MAGRGQNALTNRMPMTMPQQPMGGMPGPGGGMGQAADMVMQGAREMGYQGDDLEEAMRMLWNQSPTDGVGEMIDAAAQQTGTRPPWADQTPMPQQQMPSGGGRGGY